MLRNQHIGEFCKVFGGALALGISALAQGLEGGGTELWANFCLGSLLADSQKYVVVFALRGFHVGMFCK